MLYLPWIKKSVGTYLEVVWHIVERDKKTAYSGLSSWLGRWEPVPGDAIYIETPHRPRLWALAIGINDYASVKKLKGAVPDADAINHYLQTSLKVPKNQIINLRNHQATRAGIIAAFTQLRDNVNINKDDPILIYYAGHGGEIAASHTQTLIPVDYIPDTVRPIPDRTVFALLNQIAEKHGNNIIVILDCCHSGSLTRGGEDEEEGSIVRAAELSPTDIPEDLDADIIGGDNHIQHEQGFAQKDMNSHVLFAACSANEFAREDSRGRESTGRFTDALLDLFKNVSPDQITYADVLNRIRRIEGQNPQCEGRYQDRHFFDSKVHPPTRRCYEVKIEGNKLIMDGGRAHGITDGAEFTLFENKEGVPNSPLGVTVARQGSIGPFTTFLEPCRPGTSTTKMASLSVIIAIQTKAGVAENLKLHVPLDTPYLPVFEAVARELMDGSGARLELVDRAKAKLEVVATGKDKVRFNVLDEKARMYGFYSMPHVVDCEVDELHPILRGAAHYHFHLNHNHRNNKIDGQMLIDFFPLKSIFDGDGDEIFVPRGDSLHKRGVIEVEENATYGMKITNNTPFDLHFACLFFEYADFSITVLYSQTQFMKDAPLEKHGGTAEIGYGTRLGIPPLRCNVPEGLNLTVGFLKFYFTTDVVDLSHVPQPSPFKNPRGVKFVIRDRDLHPGCGSVLIPVIQRRQNQSLPHAQSAEMRREPSLVNHFTRVAHSPIVTRARGACLAAKDALEHLQHRHEGIVEALNSGSPITVLAGFNEELAQRDSGLLQEIHIFSATDFLPLEPALEAVGKLCSPFPSMLFMPSGSTIRPPLYNEAGETLAFERIVSSSACNMQYRNAVDKGLVLLPVDNNSDGGTIGGNGPNEVRPASGGEVTSSESSSLPSPEPQQAGGGGGRHAQEDTDDEESDRQRQESAEAAAAKPANSNSLNAGELRAGSGPPGGPDDDSQTSRSPHIIEFDTLAAIHRPNGGLIQEVQIIGTLKFQADSERGAMVQFTRMKCQAHRSQGKFQYSQGYLKVLIDTYDARWSLSNVSPTSTLASDAQERHTRGQKTNWQYAVKTVLKLNPFSAGVNLEGARTAETSLASERLLNRSRIIQRERHGVFWWGFCVDDEHEKEGGIELQKSTLPCADLTFFRKRNSTNAGPSYPIRIEVSSIWSLIQTNGSAWFTTSNDSPPPAYSNLCQMVCMDLNPGMDDDAIYKAKLNVGPLPSTESEKLKILCQDGISVTPAVLLVDDTALGNLVDDRFFSRTALDG